MTKDIFLTIEMKWHHYIGTVTMMVWQSLPCSKYIPQLSAVCFEFMIPSVQPVGFACTAAAPKIHGPWPFCAISFPIPLLHFRVIFCFCCTKCWVISFQYTVIDNGELPLTNN
jgi:hypothetical protein